VYAPLYLVGPILTFNDYISQLKHRATSIEASRTIRYGVRFVLLPWRLFRLWSLIDGIDPPENMVRCVSNNYSTQLFWRAWHRSYNRWLIRYIYVPLGGASFRNWRAIARSIITYLLVFTFVALWHDIQMRLLIWGWLIVLFMVPEWAAAAIFPKRKWESRPTEYRMLCCVGAVANVLMMMAANLVGFAVGLDGLESIIKGILHNWSGKCNAPSRCGAVLTSQVSCFWWWHARVCLSASRSCLRYEKRKSARERR